MIDTRRLKHPQDYKSDDHGVFVNNRVQHCYFTASVDDDGTVIAKRQPIKPSSSECRPGLYDLKTTNWVHKVNGDFRRRSYEVTDLTSPGGKALDFVLLQYLFQGKEHCITQAPHGHSSVDRFYRRSAPSTRKLIAQKIEGKSVSNVYDEVVENEGGVVGMKSRGSIPRSRQEISDMKRGLSGKVEKKNVDEMFKLIELCKDSVSNDPFLRQVTLAPEPMCVMASDQQLNDMKRFLTEQGNAVIMGVDATFNLGPFLATIITYRHPMLDYCESRNNPVMIGPILLHVRRTVESYAYLGQVITSICPELRAFPIARRRGAAPRCCSRTMAETTPRSHASQVHICAYHVI